MRRDPKEVEETRKQTEDTGDDGDDKDPGDEIYDIKNLRTCTVSLNQILRPDPEANEREIFVEAVAKT
ncbi:hypothetical protein BGZ51_006887 [Haplosporangium sp. Z 767]|nr:hypothetical protein BGZ50_000204 [Haplosporangium sp. Z 11]KAF9191668.1 hypothetical protein BGZ51_006887 [Haplosporangium sp. Z 767]